MNFIKDEAGFIVSVELAVILAIAIPTAVLIGNVMDDYLTVQQTMLSDHIQVMCATFAPGNEPAACANYVTP